MSSEPAVAPPANPSNSTAASFQFTSSETGSTFECQLDSGGYSTCISPQAYTSLDDGSHTFFVKATDSAGNTDPTPASYPWTIDTIAPQAFLTANPANPSFSSSATFAFISNEGTASFACKLDGELVFSECISAKTYTDLLDGSHTFGVGRETYVS